MSTVWPLYGLLCYSKREIKIYIYIYISIYYIKGKGSIHGNILEEALLNKSLKNAHSVNVIVRPFSIYLYFSEDQADLWARDKRNCSKDISREVKTATNTNKYEEITCFQKVLKRGMSQYMFCSACFNGCGTLGAGSNNQNGNLWWFSPWRGGVSNSTHLFWKMIFW